MEKFIQEFGIDYKLLLAQLFNFIILVLILGRFVYRPIIKALDKRSVKIKEGIEFSDQAKVELENIEVLKTEEMKKAEVKSLEIVKEAEKSGQQVREGILSEAEKEKEKVIQSGRILLDEEKLKLQKGFYSEASAVVVEALSKVLGKKEFKEEERALVGQALDEIQK